MIFEGNVMRRKFSLDDVERGARASRYEHRGDLGMYRASDEPSYSATIGHRLDRLEERMDEQSTLNRSVAGVIEKLSVLVDRLERREWLLWTSLIGAVMSIALAFLTHVIWRGV